MSNEKLKGHANPGMKSKHRVTIIGFAHTKPINHSKLQSLLTKFMGGGNYAILASTYRNADLPKTNKPQKP